MKTVSSWFSDSIEQYKKLSDETAELKENILTLPLEEIMRRCTSIKVLQESFNNHEEKLHEIMAFIGSDVLENPLIGKYQEALDLAIKETDQLAAQTRHRKDLLMKEIAKSQPPEKNSSRYRAGIQKYKSSLQAGNSY